ncbi:MAG: 16S rRNA (guanine(527)-N(7))-methyltransferase RsmG [Cellulomonadaceae bacterium]|jgi:16S rRNA (guanine527-N7)-methyltransferase|nr:16S rRNA (guanine(527)-N(7))-methyltransferase RsmG [Cellulomonadaceae bacterium]
MDAPDASDPQPTPADLAAYFGGAYPTLERFGELLSTEGIVRGLLGPREVPRLWERHLLNCAAVVPFLPPAGRLLDIGSGAGLPGIVIAAMRPTQEVVLIEPMERRVNWLNEVVSGLDLSNVTVLRGRASDVFGQVRGAAVTARAVAALEKLLDWSAPLLEPHGTLLALKGSSVAAEIPAPNVLRHRGWLEPEIFEARTLPGLEPTTVVKVQRSR